MKKTKINILLFFLFATILKAFPATETKNIRTGSGTLTNGLQLIVNDEKYQVTTNWWNNYNYMQHEALVRFGLDETKHKVYPNFTSQINVNIKAYGLNGALALNINDFLILNYTQTGIYNGKSVLKVGNYPKIVITVTGISSTNNNTNLSMTSPLELFLEGEVITTRYYKFPTSTYIPSSLPNLFNYNVITKPCVTGPCVSDIEVFWQYFQGAEEYELEWTWVNDYPGAPLQYDFRNDATRITTNNNHYRIPILYERGYLIFRMRGIGKKGPALNDRVEGYWTNTYTSGDFGSVTSYPTNLKYQISPGNSQTSDNMNWVSTMTFAEDGKKGAGVSYMDGMLMSRQSQAKLNTENKTITQQTIYDYQGRPAISLLPAPVNLYYFAFNNNFNLNINNLEYTKNDFDPDVNCAAATQPMSVLSPGAANYYSPNNPNQTGAQGYVADAKLYPFVQVEYTPDKTGRINAQSMPGEAHKIGNGHETKFFYSNPGDKELFRLFGSEAGNVGHYDKNMVVDANGQISTSYKDMNGKVVATALMGSKPAALDAIADYNNTEALVDDLIKFNKTDINNYTIVSSKNIFIETVNSVQTFKYEFTPEDFNDAACSPSKCFDCIYEVEFSITDNCGVNITPPINLTVGAIVNSGNVATCDNPANIVFQLSPSPISVTFPNIGTYQVSKKLKVSNIPIAQYVAEYLQSPSNTCIKTLQQYITDETNAIDFTSCGTDCQSCSTSVTQYVIAHPGLLTAAQITKLQEDCGELCAAYDPCEASRQAMITDFIPGSGQYAGYTIMNNMAVSSDPASIFFNNAPLPALGVKYNSVVFPPNLYAHIPGPNGYTYVDPATLPAIDFIKYFKIEWAELYLNYHPEKAYLDFCNLNKASDLYDYDMLQVNTYDEACQKGFMIPLVGTGSGCTNACTTVNYDPFFATGGQGLNSNSLINKASFTDQYGIYTADYANRNNVAYTYKDFMLYAFNSGYPISSNPVNNATNLVIYNLAKTQAGNTNLQFGCDPCTKDKEWILFRELYLNYKLRLVAQRKTDYVMLISSPTQTTGFNGCMINSGLNNATNPFTPSYVINPNSLASIVTNNSNFVFPTVPVSPVLTSLNFLPFTFGQIAPNIHPETFYTFMGYPVTKTPNAVNKPFPCNPNTVFYNAWGMDGTGCTGNALGDTKQPCSTGLFTTFTSKTARFPQGGFDINTLINNYTNAIPLPNIMPPVAALGPPATAAASANYCTQICTDQAEEWLFKLKDCNVSINPNPSNLAIYDYIFPDPATNNIFSQSQYISIRTDLIDVCKRGCDGNNPFGASSVNPVNVLLATGPLTFNNFSQVLNYYAPLYSLNVGPNCSVDLLGLPKPYGSNISGSIHNPSQLDTCGCNKVLGAQYWFQNINSLPAGVTTAEQYFNYIYGSPVTNFSEIECKCTAAWGNNLNNWFTTTQTNLTNWTPTQQTALTTSGPTYVPPILDCTKPCLACTTVVNAINNYNAANPTYAASNNYSTLLTTHLNHLFDYNLGFQDYMDFYNTCVYTMPANCSQVAIATKLKALINDWITFYNNDPTCIVTNSTFYNSSGPTGIPNLFNSTGTPDFLTCATTNNSPTSSGQTFPTTNPIFAAAGGGSAVIFRNIIDAALGKSCTDCELLIDILALPQTPLPVCTNISFNIINNNVQVPPSSPYNYNFSFGLDNEDYSGIGYFSCLPSIVPCYNSSMLCDKPHPIITIKDDCASSMINNAYNNALNLFNQQITAVTDNFTKRYKDKCLAITDEKFERTYNLNEYHYTLYYYDQAGNLVRTVPPKGVAILAAAQYNTVPPHKYVTNYTYQSYNAPLVSQSPDETATTDYVYDKIGRIIASANAKQKAATGGPFASYTIYDAFGRISEVGEVNASLNTIQTAINANVSVKTIIAVFSQVIKTYYDVQLNNTISSQFPNATQLNLRNRVASVTYEDTDDFNDNTYKHATHYSYDEHGNVKNMVQENGSLSPIATKYFTLEYDYDIISGNVNKVSFQKNRADKFFHKYEYDDDNRLHLVITSKDGLIWNRDAKYFYYDHGPLARKELGEQKVHAEDFAYTIQGWIKAVNSNMLDTKTDIGKDGDASNYSSTITNIHNYFGRDAFGYSLNYFGQGTYKDYRAIKNANFNATNDKNLVASINNISTGSAPFDLQTHAPDLYNGNISSMVTSIIDKDPTNVIQDNTAFPQLTAYKYDQLHRIKQMKAYRDFDFINNQWNASAYDNSYESAFTYDKNGNILTHFRNGTTSAIVAASFPLMDNMTYLYEDNGNNVNTNKLIGVNDAAIGSAYTTDIKGYSAPVIGSPNTYDYTYDNIGNLISDKKEFIDEIKWTVDRKVAAVIRNRGLMFAANKNMPDIFFEYDANRQRVVKIEKPILNNGTTYPYLTQDNWKSTYYVRDASGNIMSTYANEFTLDFGNVFDYKTTVQEFDIYGSARLGNASGNGAFIAEGTFNNSTNGFVAAIQPLTGLTFQKKVNSQIGSSSYELSNHLGNVITVISDRKTGVDGPVPDNIIDYYLADVRETHDFYPFGYEMPGRTFGSDYRNGFNGKEKDKELNAGASNFGMREYDERLGRFFSLDPKRQSLVSFSPYIFAANSPIAFDDENGEGPRYKVMAQAYVNCWKEIKNQSKGIKGVDIQISKVEFTQIKQEVRITVKVTMFGTTYDKTVTFSSKDNDIGHHSDLVGAGIDGYEAMILESEKFSDRAYYRAKQLDEFYEKPENGIPLVLKTGGAVLTGVVGAAEFITANIISKAFFVGDVAFTMNDMTVVGYGPNKTALDVVGDKVGLSKEQRENFGLFYDIVNLSISTGGLIHDLANDIKLKVPTGAALINLGLSELNSLISLQNRVSGWRKTNVSNGGNKKKGTFDSVKGKSENCFNREKIKD